MYGYAGNDVINGDGGNDHLYGGKGVDALWGGAWQGCVRVQRRTDQRQGCASRTSASSTTRSSWTTRIFSKVGGNGALKSGAFYSNTTGKAHDASDRVIYDKDSGVLYYDADGTGAKAGVAFATIGKNLKMTAPASCPHSTARRGR